MAAEQTWYGVFCKNVFVSEDDIFVKNQDFVQFSLSIFPFSVWESFVS